MSGQEVIMLVGLPGSGKSTWARAWLREHPDYVRVNNDAIRLQLFGERYNPETEGAVRAARIHMVRRALAEGRSVVVDNCNITTVAQRETRALAREVGAAVRVVSMLHVPVAECIRRDRLREYPVGANVIRRFASTAALGGTGGR